MANMKSVFHQFKQAQLDGSGTALAESLTPTTSAQNPVRLRSFYYFTDSVNASSDIRYALLHDRSTGSKLPKQEANAWVDIFVAFWKSAGELVKINEFPEKGSWTKVFIAWKELSTLLIRGYSTLGLQAWTLPCLYVVGKYLRIFAIKADAETVQDSTAYNGAFGDDVITDSAKSARLEETSQVVNRMFTLCLHDRYVHPSPTLVLRSHILNHIRPGLPLRNHVNGVYTTQSIFH